MLLPSLSHRSLKTNRGPEDFYLKSMKAASSRLHPACFQHSVQKRARLMAWEGISAHMGNLHLCEGSIKAEWFILILGQHMLSCRYHLCQRRPHSALHRTTWFCRRVQASRPVEHLVAVSFILFIAWFSMNLIETVSCHRKVYDINPFRCSGFLKTCICEWFLNNTGAVLCETPSGNIFKRIRWVKQVYVRRDEMKL